MSEITVSTKQELKKAVEARYDKIIITGSIVEDVKKQIQKKKRTEKIATITGITAGVIALGSIVAAPFTGGVSLFGLTAAGATATTAAGTTIVLSTTEFFLLLCAAGGISYGAFRAYKKVTFSGNGKTITLER